jgi:catechol 2,3-dioxygenase-like lactoylglutathione lyase family enzyme
MTLKVQALDHLVVQVSDLEVSASWYKRVLGMTREDVAPAPGQPPRTAMRFGRQKINLRPNWCEQGKLVHRRPRGCGQRGSVLSHGLDARSGRPAFAGRDKAR